MTLERLNALARRGEVTVVHLGSRSDVPLATVSGDRIAAGVLRSRTPSVLVNSYLHGLPLSVWRNTVPEFTALVRSLRERRWDLVYADHWLVWEAARQVQSVPKVLHLHNAEPALFDRAAARLRWPHSWASRLEGIRSWRYLRRIISEATELHLLSPADAEVLATGEVRHPNTRVFLPAADAHARASRSFSSRSDVALFVGTLSWLPNAEGLEWFLRSAWPLVKGGGSFEIIGGGAPPALLDLARCSARTVARGYVDDIEDAYATARCLVAPLQSGSGIKIKIVNALARGLPVVTTSVGAEGLPEGEGEGLQVADSPGVFAACVDRVMSDPDAWTAASASALAYAARHFSGESFREWCASLERDRRLVT